MTSRTAQPRGAQDGEAIPRRLDASPAEWLEIWHVDLGELGPELEAIDAEHGLLPVGELQSFDRTLDIVPPAAERLRMRRRARIALRALLSSYGAPDAKGVPFAVDGHGKPALPSGNPAFNMSHSEQRCLIAIGAPAPLGIDLELPRTVQLGPVRQALIIAAGDGLAERPGRLEVDSGKETSPIDFLRAWTRLEAFAKARGDGIGHLLTTLGITASGVRDLTIDEARARAAALIEASGLRIADITMPQGGSGAIAAAGRLIAKFSNYIELKAAHIT